VYIYLSLAGKRLSKKFGYIFYGCCTGRKAEMAWPTIKGPLDPANKQHFKDKENG
jgi:hypothetical protein